MGRIEPVQGNRVNGRGRTSCCYTYRTRQVKAVHVVERSDVPYMDVTVFSYPMPVDKSRVYTYSCLLC